MSTVFIRDTAVRKRLFWIREAQRLGVNQACLKLGLFKSQFYYWKRRFDQSGIEGLRNRSCRPRSSPRLSRSSLVLKILELRRETGRGAETIALLLSNRYGLKVCRSTVHRILVREGQIRKKERPPKKRHRLRYQALNPGDRVQIDVKYVPYRIQEGRLGKVYQYTAIDDCSRARFCQIYSGHGIFYLKDFLDKMTAFFPFPIKLIQTDNDVVFTYKYTAHKQAFRKAPKEHYLEAFCREHQIRHHLIEPLKTEHALWIDYYNHHRPHWGIQGKTPSQKLATFGFNLGRISHDKYKKYSLAA